VDHPLGARAPTVHPHGRGDNTLGSVTGEKYTGSPPRAWGQRYFVRKITIVFRFTPTGVGTTWRWAARSALWSVHPHGRGDNSDLFLSRSDVSGSPPRAWGQLDGVQPVLAPSRFTPTGVGTTSPRRSPGRGSPVHPHGRGDNVIGETTRGLVSVHPHGRGDNGGSPPCPRVRPGSPPRAWGQPWLSPN